MAIVGQLSKFLPATSDQALQLLSVNTLKLLRLDSPLFATNARSATQPLVWI